MSTAQNWQRRGWAQPGEMKEVLTTGQLLLLRFFCEQAGTSALPLPLHFLRGLSPLAQLCPVAHAAEEN